MFFSSSKSKLGIDIGTASIKVTQLKNEEGKYILENYGIVNVSHHMTGPQFVETNVIADTAGILKKLLAETGVSTKKVVASLPNNVVFISVIDVPQLSESELKNAIQWEARRYVPLPLEEVTLSWSVLAIPQETGKLKVLITAVPTSVIENYLKMFKLAGLQPEALEIEALALIRALVGNRQESFIIIDIGARNTSLNLVDRGFLRVSRNLAVGGENFTTAVAQSLHISFTRAEQFKRDLGLAGNMQQFPQTIKPAMDTIKEEAMQLMKIFESGGGTIKEIILAGSSAVLPGLLSYFVDMGPKVVLGDPLKFISYDARLKNNLSKISLNLSIALGLAMRD